MRIRVAALLAVRFLRPGGVVLSMCAALVLALGPSTWAATGGTRLWASRYNGPGNDDDVALSLAASPDGSKVFVTGYSYSYTTGDDYTTIAYDASTGGKLWVARYNGPGNGSDFAWSLAMSPDGLKVFVTGSSYGGIATGYDYATVAYDAATGGRLWVKRYNGPGNVLDYARAVTAAPDGSKVFVTGGSTGVTNDQDYATAAYDASTGATFWVKRYKNLGTSDAAHSVAASPDGSMVFVTGNNATVAYDASTGARLWVRTSIVGISLALSPDGSTVFVTGEGRIANYVTVAHDASSGARLWRAHYNGSGNGNDFAYSIAASPDGSKVFVTGGSLGTTSSLDYATVAYNASTGTQLWVARYSGPGNDSDEALSIAASLDGLNVFVTGLSPGTTPGDDYATVAYDAATGAKVWVRRYNGLGKGDDIAYFVVSSPDGSKVFVTGYSRGTASSSDYTTVAYTA